MAWPEGFVQPRRLRSFLPDERQLNRLMTPAQGEVQGHRQENERQDDKGQHDGLSFRFVWVNDQSTDDLSKRRQASRQDAPPVCRWNQD